MTARPKLLVLLICLLLSCQLSFAASWTGTAAIAIVTSAVILAIVYMLGLGFDINELKFLAHEEFYQLLVTIVMIGVLAGSQAWLDGLTPGLGLSGMSLQDGSISIISAELSNHKAAYNALMDFSIVLGKQSSKSYYCSLEGVGFTAAPCNSFRALTSPVSMSFQALSMSITELNSIYTLLNFSKQYAFVLLLPLGILLRTFKITRGAGGLFIGLGVALYLFLPIAVLFMSIVLDPSGGYNPGFSIAPSDLALQPSPSCDETHFGTFGGGVSYDNLNNAVGVFNGLEQKINVYVYLFLIRGTMTTVVSVLALYASLRAVSKLAGAEIDISALARVA